MKKYRFDCEAVQLFYNRLTKDWQIVFVGIKKRGFSIDATEDQVKKIKQIVKEDFMHKRDK